MDRYSRQHTLADFGQTGQSALHTASVLVIGCGGLGVPAAIYLASCGVGKIGLADGDVVAQSNLHRQVAYHPSDIGQLKTEVLCRYLKSSNPETHVETLPFFLDEITALEWIPQFDIILDGSDQIEVKKMIDRACKMCNKPWIYGSADGWEGQLAVLNSLSGDPADRFYYSDLFDSHSDQNLIGNCSSNGVLGIVPGIIGLAQALEAIKLISGKGQGSSGHLQIFDGYSSEWKKIKLHHRHEKKEFPDSVFQLDSDWSVGELKQIIESSLPILWVDVREDHERDSLISGAIHIPMDQWLDRWSELPSHLPVVVFCASGYRSRAAVSFARQRADRPLLRSAALADETMWPFIPPSLQTQNQGV